MNTKPSSANNRFYPDEIPYHQNEPSREKFEIIITDFFGEGVIAKTSFQTGDLLFRFDGKLLKVQTLFTLQKKAGLYLEDCYFAGKILHSCDPNTTVDMDSQMFFAIKPITAGEYVTMDYETTEDELFRSFYCRCRSKNCRGRIAGRLCK